MKRLILVDASIVGGETESYVLSIPASDPDLRVLIDEEPTSGMLEHLGPRIRSTRESFPPSGLREREVLEDARGMVRDVLESEACRAYNDRLRSAGLPTIEGAAVEMRFVGIYPVLCRVTAIRDFLKQDSWDRVEIFSTTGHLAEAFSIASALEGYRGERVETFSLSRMSRWRRVRKKVGRWVRERIAIPSLLREFIAFRLQRNRGEGKRQLPSHPDYYLFCIHPLETSLYISTLAPLIRKADEAKRALVLLDWRNAGDRTTRSMKLEACHPSEFFTSGDYARAVVDLFRLRRAWNSTLGGGRAAETFLYGGESLWPLIDWLVHRDWFRQVFWLSVWQRAVGRILESSPPRGIVLSVDFSWKAKLAASIAKEAGIPSFYVQPALLTDSGRFDDLTAHHALLMDAFSRDIFRGRGVADERLHVMGLTRWDGLAARRERSPNREIRGRLGVPPERPLVFLAGTQGPIREKTELIAAVLGIIDVVPDVHICLKPHPNDPHRDYGSFFSRLPEGVFSLFPADLDMHDLILAADLTITSFSNVAIEAAILDRPVLAINLRGEPDVFPYEAEGIAFSARSPAEVKSQVARFLGDEAFRAELKEARNGYLERNPQYRIPGVAERILKKMDEISALP